MSREQFAAKIMEGVERRANMAEVKRYLSGGACCERNYRSITKRMQRQKRRIYG